MLFKMTIKDPLKWYQNVHRLQSEINLTVTRSTGKAPFNLLFGVKMHSPKDDQLVKMQKKSKKKIARCTTENEFHYINSIINKYTILEL